MCLKFSCYVNSCFMYILMCYDRQVEQALDKVAEIRQEIGEKQCNTCYHLCLTLSLASLIYSSACYTATEL